MKISEQGIRFIKNHEGLRLTRYKDQAGLWTIGYGHLQGPKEKETTITEARAEQLLRSDLIKAELLVNSVVAVRLTQYEYDALVSFAFNIGNHAFAHSTLLQKLNRKDKGGAYLEFDRWIYAGHKVSKGLMNRRDDEQKLFRGDWK